MEDRNKQFPAKKRKKTQGQLLIRDILILLLKIAVICAVIVLLFTFLFGIYRCENPSMYPSVKDGDLVIFYRIDKRYSASDAIVMEYNGKLTALRVAAVEGDEVDIRDGQLYINGAQQIEDGIYSATYRYENSVEFPMKIPEGEVFVLGDNRNNATDSRIFGPVAIKETKGKIMSLIRRRGI